MAENSPGGGNPGRGVPEQLFVRLLGLVRTRLFGQIRSEKDVPVVDSILSSFFANHVPEDIDWDDPDSPWPALSRVALRHCNKHNKRLQRSEGPSFIPIGVASPDQSGGGFEPAANDISPDAEVEFTEFLRHFQQKLSERERKVLELALAQETQGDIARQLRVSQTTVCYDLKRIREMLEKQDDEA
jgi:RNA polymerase sigma factor (sigma-70 family)